jgi:hypothetical protein
LEEDLYLDKLLIQMGKNKNIYLTKVFTFAAARSAAWAFQWAVRWLFGVLLWNQEFVLVLISVVLLIMSL